MSNEKTISSICRELRNENKIAKKDQGEDVSSLENSDDERAPTLEERE